MTREFHADPNLHKNANVELVGDYSTDGSPSITFEWPWTWKPPKSSEDRGGGWRNSCSVRHTRPRSRSHRMRRTRRAPYARSIDFLLTMCAPQFVEYDQRGHRLVTLASFSFWVASMSRLSRYGTRVAATLSADQDLLQTRRII